jgi:hypothetical protein
MASFYQWLQGQTDREDMVGDFAFTVGQFCEPEPSRKKISGHMKWASWLVDMKASSELIEAFNMAWREFQDHSAPVA